MLARPITLVVLVACATLPSCGQGELTTGPEEEIQGAVLILLDTVRADHLGCYGYRRPLSPHLDALARRSVRFDRTVASSPWTLPSVAAMLSGEHPQRALANDKLERSLVTRLQEAGITTAAITEGGWVSRVFRLDLGFDQYTEEEGPVQLLGPGERRDPDATGGIERTFALAREWLIDHRDERFFLFIHTYEPHTPYTNLDFTAGLPKGRFGREFPIELLERLQSGQVTLTEEEVEYAKALYDGDILSSDRHVGSFLTFLEEEGLRERVLITVASDHGEEFADHYPSFTGSHGHSLRDPLVLVPLILHDPTRRYPVREVSTQVRLFDLMPTILELLGVPVDRSIEGASLVPVMGGEETDDRMAFIGMTRRGPRRIGLRGMGFKYIATVGRAPDGGALTPVPDARQLFDLTNDPGETRNLAGEKPAVAAEFHRLLELERERAGPGSDPEAFVPLDPDVRERLRSLGYVEEP
jgi:arylsulfatase A-like enzyme